MLPLLPFAPFVPPSETPFKMSRDLARCIPGSVYFETLPEVTAYLRGAAQKGDLILTVGAGDIYKAGEALLKEE